MSLIRPAALLLLAAVLPASPSSAACNRPSTADCAVQKIPFASAKDADDCRKDMLRFRDGMDAYAACLAPTSADAEKQARADYEDVWKQFNRRARGEFGKIPGTESGPE